MCRVKNLKARIQECFDGIHPVKHGDAAWMPFLFKAPAQLRITLLKMGVLRFLGPTASQVGIEERRELKSSMTATFTLLQRQKLHIPVSLLGIK